MLVQSCSKLFCKLYIYSIIRKQRRYIFTCIYSKQCIILLQQHVILCDVSILIGITGQRCDKSHIRCELLYVAYCFSTRAQREPYESPARRCKSRECPERAGIDYAPRDSSVLWPCNPILWPLRCPHRISKAPRRDQRLHP